MFINYANFWIEFILQKLIAVYLVKKFPPPEWVGVADMRGGRGGGDKSKQNNKLRGS
jgi:hypothetical protein